MTRQCVCHCEQAQVPFCGQDCSGGATYSYLLVILAIGAIPCAEQQNFDHVASDPLSYISLMIAIIFNCRLKNTIEAFIY